MKTINIINIKILGIRNTILYIFMYGYSMQWRGLLLFWFFSSFHSVIPYIMNLISLIGIITILLGATLALDQKDIQKSLAYSTMSQLGYTMLALVWTPYFHTMCFHSMVKLIFCLFGENYDFQKRLGFATYFCFIFKGKTK